MVISHGVESVNHPNKSVNETVEIIFIGVLYEHKGVKALPAIIRSLEERNIDFHFTIVGSGVLVDWLTEQFKSEISRGIVEMTGVISHDEVYRRMANADIFLYPTHLDSFGLVIAEAMMNGAVPVVTNLKGVTDNLISNNVDGYLIEKDDINGFASTIAQLANDRETLNKVSKLAHQHAVAALSIEQMQSNYNRYLSSL
jgi:glycosyltransferase involved in cell wall biosynthesis